jgi:hypothetical protein
MARGMGGWANCGVIVFSSGFVGTAGTHTASGTNPSLQFPPHKVVTGITLTPKSEFALVTLTDVRTRKGQVAVIALQNGGWSGFVHDWQDRYPCPGNSVAFGNEVAGLCRFARHGVPHWHRRVRE